MRDDRGSGDGWLVVIALALLAVAAVPPFLVPEDPAPREVILSSSPVFIPCPVPVWDAPPRDLDDMAERADLARRMMEECGAMREEAKRSK